MADWIILDKTTGIGSDEVTITVSSYTELTERLKNLVFTTTDNKASDTCIVKQYGEEGYLKVNPSSINMVYGGGYVDVTVSSTEDWTIGTLPAWISSNTSRGSKGDTIIRLTISSNSSTSERSYSISFVSENYNASLSVTQAKYVEGEIVPPTINPDDCEGGTFTVTIKGDGCWSFKKDVPTPSPICDDALVWGTYDIDTLNYDNVPLYINEISEYPRVDGVNWAVCGYTGGTLKNLRNFMYDGRNYNGKYKKYNSVKFSPNFNTSNVTDMNDMFYLCERLSSLDVSSFDTSNVTDMHGMFYYCRSLTSLDLSNFNTSKVTDMSKMFSACNLANFNLSNFNTSNVINMNNMFSGCTSLTSLHVSNFNTSKVTDMSKMFCFCDDLTSLDLSNFDTSNVTDMSGMFYYCYNLSSLDVSSFNTSKVTDMSEMFYFCSGLTSLDLSSFDTSNVTNMSGMFYECNLTSLDLSSFDTSNVTDMSYMFSGCSLTNLVASNWNTSNVSKMNQMFQLCDKLTTLDLSNWNTSNVTDMSGMFYICDSLTSLDLSNFDTSNATYMGDMFGSCYKLTEVKVTNCPSATQQKILARLKTDLSSYTWTLSNGIITRS